MTDNDPTRQFENIIRGAAPTAFAEGFSERVLERLHDEKDTSLNAALERQFKRIVPLAAAASLLLAAYNWWGTRDGDRTALERALNLPKVTIASALTVGTESQ